MSANWTCIAGQIIVAVRLMAILVIVAPEAVHAKTTLESGRLSQIDDSEFRGRKEVIIYYANDAYLNAWSAQSREAASNWLQAIDPASADRFNLLVDDYQSVFAQALADEIEQMRQAYASSANATNAAIIVVTNELAHRGKVLVLDDGSKALTEEELFLLEESQDHRIMASPLAGPKFFESFLAYVEARFKDRHPVYSLIIKSHSTDGKIVEPFINFSPQELARRLSDDGSDRDRAYSHLLSDRGLTELRLSDFMKILGDGQSMGLSAEEFIRAISRGGGSKMSFFIIYLDQCSDVELPSMAVSNIANIGLFFRSTQSTGECQSMDYLRMLRIAENSRLTTSLKHYLQAAAGLPPPRPSVGLQWLAALVGSLGVLTGVIAGCYRRR